MPGAILHKTDQPVMRRALRHHLIHQRADHPHQIDVPRFVLAADVVGPPHLPLSDHRQQRIGMIFHKQPVAHILTRPVDRDRFARERVQDHHRDQLFREMVRPVIVRAIAQNDGQTIGVPPRHHQMIRRCLGRRIRRARIIRRLFGELAVSAQRPKHLVSRDMVKPKRFRAPLSFPVSSSGLQERVGPDHVRLNKRPRPVDRPIHVRFSGQMHHRIRLMFGKNSL